MLASAIFIFIAHLLLSRLHRARKELTLFWRLNVKQPRLSRRPSNVLLFFFFLAWTRLYSLSLLIVDRVQRLKDARSEAAKEIEELKAQKNAEYQNFVAQVRKSKIKGQ